MGISKFNEWLTLIANLGVIAGIIFLGLEIQQNTDMMQSQTRDAMTQKQMDWYMTIGSNLDAAENFFTIQGEGFENSERPPHELSAFQFVGNANFRMWENEWYQYQKGLYEEDEFLARSRIWSGVLNQPGYTDMWREQRLNYTEEFREYLENMLAEFHARN